MFLEKMFKFLLIFISVNIFSFANNTNLVQINILDSDYFTIKNGKVIKKKNTANAFAPQIQKQLIKLYGKPFSGENGKLVVQLIIKPSIGKVSDYLIYKNKGNKPFKKHVNIFLKKILNKRILYSNDGKTYQFKILVSIKSAKAINNIKNYLVFGKNGDIQQPYNYYIYYLIKYKKYPKELIKKELNSKETSITKAMLYYLYFTYKKPNKKYSNFYFNVLMNNSDKIKGKIESVFLGDNLLLKEEYFKILELLPDKSCGIIPDFKLKSICNYYQGIGKYMNNYDDFLLNLKQAQSISADRKFLKTIGY